jgi:hypothetical protein
MFNLFGKNTATPVESVKPTTSEMMEYASTIVDGALSAFTQAVQAIERANSLLDDASNSHNEKISELEDSLMRVKSEKELASANRIANLALKEKLMQFIK